MMEVGRGDSAAAGGGHAGPLGLHLVTLAPPSPAPTAGLGLKERRRSLRSGGPLGLGQHRAQRGCGKRGPPMSERLSGTELVPTLPSSQVAGPRDPGVRSSSGSIQRAGANEPPLTGAGEAAGRLDKRTRGEQQGQVQAEALSREGSGKTLERSNVRAPGEDSRAQSWPEVLSESQTDRGPRPPTPQEVPRRGRALKTASFGHLGLQCAHITCTLTHTPLALTVIGKLTFFYSFSLKLNATPTH